VIDCYRRLIWEKELDDSELEAIENIRRDYAIVSPYLTIQSLYSFLRQCYDGEYDLYRERLAEITLRLGAYQSLDDRPYIRTYLVVSSHKPIKEAIHAENELGLKAYIRNNLLNLPSRK